MKRIAVSLLAVGFLAAPVLAAESAKPTATPAAVATGAPATGETAASKPKPQRLASAKKRVTHRRHKRHAKAAVPQAKPSSSVK